MTDEFESIVRKREAENDARIARINEGVTQRNQDAHWMLEWRVLDDLVQAWAEDEPPPNSNLLAEQIATVARQIRDRNWIGRLNSILDDFDPDVYAQDTFGENDAEKYADQAALIRGLMRWIKQVIDGQSSLELAKHLDAYSKRTRIQYADRGLCLLEYGQYPKRCNGCGNPLIPCRWTEHACRACCVSAPLASGSSAPQETEPAKPKDDDDLPNSCKGLESCKPSERKAYYSFKLAEAMKKRRLEDREAWDLLKENDWSEHYTEELTDYKFPPTYTSWVRQLRTAQKATKEQKYTPRTHK